MSKISVAKFVKPSEEEVLKFGLMKGRLVR